LRHPGEYPEQRLRRRWLATLAEHDSTLPDPYPAINADRSVTRVCQCSHTEGRHAVSRFVPDWPCVTCDCARFRPVKVQIGEALD
jgi:hypothetical protein